MMFAHAEDVEANLIGELDFLEEVAEPVARAGRHARARVGRRFGE